MDRRLVREAVVAWAPVAAYAALIWVVSATSVPVFGGDFVGRDKLLHVAEFALFGALVGRALVRTLAWRARPSTSAWRVGLLAALACAGWGFLDEVHQSSVPGRTASAWDLLADVVGATVGAFAYAGLRGVRRLEDRARAGAAAGAGSSEAAAARAPSGARE